MLVSPYTDFIRRFIKMKQLERIAERFRSGVLSSREAAFEVIHLIGKMRPYFNLENWTPEDYEDFLLKEVPHIANLLETFDPRKANFSTFFYKSFMPAARSYTRKKVSRIAAEESINSMSSLLLEEHEYRYAQDEGEICVEAACAEEDLRQWTYRNSKDRRDCIMNRMQKKYFRSAEDEKIEDLRRSACLILFLKSSAVADDASVRNTSIVTGISEEKLFYMMTELKEKLELKMARRQETNNARDSAFFLRRKYRIQDKKLDDGGMLQKKISDLLRKQSERWEKDNWRLETDFNITPTNKEIGEILNLSGRKVAYILKVARQKIDEIRKRN